MIYRLVVNRLVSIFRLFLKAHCVSLSVHCGEGAHAQLVRTQAFSLLHCRRNFVDASGSRTSTSATARSAAFDERCSGGFRSVFEH